MKFAIFLAVSLTVLILSCSQQQIPSNNAVITHEAKPENAVKIIEGYIPQDYSKFYAESEFIHLYGVKKTRLISILSSINRSYFEGLDDLSVIYSNKDALTSSGTHDKNGFYVPNKIEIYI